MILCPVDILLVDDQIMFREALRLLLSQQGTVRIIGEAGRGEDALRFCMQQIPRVVLMDLKMPGMSGVEATRRLRQQHPDMKILILTATVEEEEVFDALRAGASGYILKTSPARQLVEAIQIVALGQTYIQPAVASVLVAGLGRFGPMLPKQENVPNPVPPRPLSDREHAILYWMSQGRSNKEIALELTLSEGTVKNHVSHILGKLGAADRNSAALRARQLGINSPTPAP